MCVFTFFSSSSTVVVGVVLSPLGFSVIGRWFVRLFAPIS